MNKWKSLGVDVKDKIKQGNCEISSCKNLMEFSAEVDCIVLRYEIVLTTGKCLVKRKIWLWSTSFNQL